MIPLTLRRLSCIISPLSLTHGPTRDTMLVHIIRVPPLLAELVKTLRPNGFPFRPNLRVLISDLFRNILAWQPLNAMQQLKLPEPWTKWLQETIPTFPLCVRPSILVTAALLTGVMTRFPTFPITTPLTRDSRAGVLHRVHRRLALHFSPPSELMTPSLLEI